MKRLALFVVLSALALTAQTKKILVMGGGDAMVKDLQSASDKVRVVGVTNANVMQEITDADAFIGEITPEQVRAGKKLKWVQIMSAGAERVLFMSGGNDLRDSDIVLTNNRIVQGPEIADHAFAMLLMLTRQLYKLYMNDKQEDLAAPTIRRNRTAWQDGRGRRSRRHRPADLATRLGIRNDSDRSRSAGLPLQPLHLKNRKA